MDRKTEQKIGIHIFLGSLTGAIFGIALFAGTSNSILGFGGGAFAGAFIGWFIAAAVMEKGKKS